MGDPRERAVRIITSTPEASDLDSVIKSASRASRTAVYRRRRIVAGTVLGTLVTASTLLSAISLRSTGDNTAEQSGKSKDCPTYTVVYGDTAWRIAGKIVPEGDRRPVVDELLKVNHKKEGNLKPGDELKLPC